MLLKLAEAISRANRAIARAVAWLSLAMVLLSFSVVLLRYGFGIGSIAMQEAVVYLHATMFLSAIAGTLAVDAHVRVDVLRPRFSERARAGIEALGALLFTLPLALFIGALSWQYVADAWARGETSSEPGGLPWVWALKTLLLSFSAQLALQAIADAIRHAHRALKGH